MPRRPRPNISAAEKAFLLEDSVIYEIKFALGVPEYVANDYCIWESINFTRIAHARVLYDFFTQSISDTTEGLDDLVSEDFSFGPMGDLLKDEVKRINKGLMHISASRAKRSLEEKQWQNDLLILVHKWSVEFIDHILAGKMDTGITIKRDDWENLATILKSGHELRMRHLRYLNDNGQEGGIEFLGPGRKLASGYSELTELKLTKKLTG